jgi:predicted secreted hydrolase
MASFLRTPNPQLRTASLLSPAHAAETTWRQAIDPWQWSFPRDHGRHTEFRTEWWYFTGNLSDASGNRYGYQLTFFRQGLTLTPSKPGNVWSVRDVYLAHFAVTDVTNKSFSHADRASREGPGLAGAATGQMDVWTLNWSARMDEQGTIRLSARRDRMALDLTLTARKPLVRHGKNGLSGKGPKAGQSSYYYSFTDLVTRGTIEVPGGKVPLKVTGVSWFDQEFGSNQLSPDQVGWDWFALHLSDGRDLMIYLLRRKDGTVEPTSSGTLVEGNGAARHLALSDVEVTVMERWKSEKTGGVYPSRWRIRIPGTGIDIEVKSLLSDQELTTTASTGVTYWEGAVDGKGVSGGREVTAEGYVEQTGYAGSLSGVF